MTIYIDKFLRLRLLFFVVIFVNYMSSASADVIDFREGLDGITDHGATYIRSDNPSSKNNNQNRLLAGMISAGRVDRILLEFDLNTLVNGYDTIDGVTLSLTTLDPGGSAASTQTANFDIFKYDYDLNETSSTWNNPDGLVDGDPTAGGTYDSSNRLAYFSDVKTSDDFNTTYQSTEESSSFSAAVVSALNDDGILRLLLKGDYEVWDTDIGKKYARFYDDTVADDSGTSGVDETTYRPTLTITYSVPELNNIALLIGLSLIPVLLLSRRGVVKCSSL